MASPRILLTAEDTALLQGDGVSVFLLEGSSPFSFGDDGVGGPKAKKKQKVIRLYDADRETTAQFLKEQLKLRQFPDPLKETRERKEKRVIVSQNKREAKMRAEHEKEEARQKEEVLKMNNAILQLIALAHDA